MGLLNWSAWRNLPKTKLGPVAEQYDHPGGRPKKHTVSTPNLRSLYHMPPHPEPQSDSATLLSKAPPTSGPGHQTPLQSTKRRLLSLRRKTQDGKQERSKTSERRSILKESISRPLPQFSIFRPHTEHPSDEHASYYPPESSVESNLPSRPQRWNSLNSGLYHRPEPDDVPVDCDYPDFLHDFLLAEAILENPEYFVMNPSWDPIGETTTAIFLTPEGCLPDGKYTSFKRHPSLSEVKRKRRREAYIPYPSSVGWDPTTLVTQSSASLSLFTETFPSDLPPELQVIRRKRNFQ